ncbi:MAG TPA: hypothetical protein VGI60_05130 [Chthoniobacterales bacterium]
MISPLRLLRLDASLVLLLIVGVCATGGLFFAFYETEETERPLAIVRHRPREPIPLSPVAPTVTPSIFPATGGNSVTPQATNSPNEITRP